MDSLRMYPALNGVLSQISTVIVWLGPIIERFRARNSVVRSQITATTRSSKRHTSCRLVPAAFFLLVR